MILKKEIVGTDIKAFLNDDRFKVNINNKPRVFANTIKINNEKVASEKVILRYVIIGKIINARHGPLKLKKCYTIIRKKQFIMITL